jgi:hypothetical protein
MNERSVWHQKKAQRKMRCCAKIIGKENSPLIAIKNPFLIVSNCVSRKNNEDVPRSEWLTERASERVEIIAGLLGFVVTNE